MLYDVPFPEFSKGHPNHGKMWTVGNLGVWTVVAQEPFVEWPVPEDPPPWEFLRIMTSEAAPECCRPVPPWSHIREKRLLMRFMEKVHHAEKRGYYEDIYVLWITCRCNHGVAWGARVEARLC